MLIDYLIKTTAYKLLDNGVGRLKQRRCFSWSIEHQNEGGRISKGNTAFLA
jgi:hypothetical protein